MAPAPKKPDESSYVGRFAVGLRAFREKAGLTGEQAATAISKAGCTVAMRTYYGWESGTRQPPIESLPAIAKGLKVKSPRLLIPEE